MNLYTDAQQHFRSNRKHHRIDAGLHCEVGQPGGSLSAAKVLDLSVGGLKFSCSRQIVNDIIPDDERTVGLIMDVDVDIQFSLPADSEHATAIKTGARIIHTERLAQDLFHVGIEFNNLDIDARRQLEAYIESLEQ